VLTTQTFWLLPPLRWPGSGIRRALNRRARTMANYVISDGVPSEYVP